MPRKKVVSHKPGDSYNVKIGNNASNVAIGKNITQIHGRQLTAGELSEIESGEVRSLFTQLKESVKESAPADKREAALERIREIEEELLSNAPTMSTLEYVSNWFKKNIPSLFETIISIFTNPIISKIIEATSGVAAEELKKRIFAS